MEDDPESSDPEWYQDTQNPNLVWWWDGTEWTGPTPINLALLNQLTMDNRLVMSQFGNGMVSIREEVSKIRFRVGFLALVVLVPLVISILAIGNFISIFGNSSP